MDIQELLGEELFQQVTEKLGDKKLIINDGTMIPKAKFDEVNVTKNELKTQVEAYTKQLADLQTKAVGNEELGRKIAELQAQNEKTVTEAEAKLKQKTLDHAIELAIVNAKGKNAKALKALLDIEQIKIDDNGVTGIDEQIKALKTSDSWLFDTGASQPGANPPTQGGLTLEAQYADLKKQVAANPRDEALKSQMFQVREQINAK